MPSREDLTAWSFCQALAHGQVCVCGVCGGGQEGEGGAVMMVAVGHGSCVRL